MTNVLVGEISSYKAIVICNYFKKTYPHIKIFTYDHLKFSRRCKTKYCGTYSQLSKESLPAYLHELASLVHKYKIDIFFPVHSDSIEAIIKNKHLFGNSLKYLGRHEDYLMLHNKKVLGELAHKLGIAVPQKFGSYKDARIPFVAKPADQSSSKGVFYFTDTKTWDENKNVFGDNYIFQEFVQGRGCGYSVYAENGVILKEYGHMRLAEYPVSGGSSVYRESFFLTPMKEIAMKILNEVKWTGFAMFEYKLTMENKLVLIEVNPRIWGSINQGLQNGVNYFETLIHEQPINATTINDTRTYLSPQIYWSFLKYILKGNFIPLRNYFQHLLQNRADVSFFDDPSGWMSIVIRSIYR